MELTPKGSATKTQDSNRCVRSKPEFLDAFNSAAPQCKRYDLKGELGTMTPPSGQNTRFEMPVIVKPLWGAKPGLLQMPVD